MRLKEIHEEYCEKQRIEEEEAIRIENDRKQKELEEQIAKEKEIIERLKPLFLQQFDEEVKAIEEAGISLRYVAIHDNQNHLFIELESSDFYNCIKYSQGGVMHLNGVRAFSKEQLMSLIYQHFFCQ